MKLKKILTFVFCGIGIFCISYYFGKFYIQKYLSFSEESFVYFTIISTIIIIGLIFSILNAIKIDKVQKQNVELLNQISHLSKQIGCYHYSEMGAIKDNMECILDLDKGDE